MKYNNMVCRWYVNIEDRATRKMVAMNIAGEQVWITGGGSGIGLGIANAFAARGIFLDTFQLQSCTDCVLCKRSHRTFDCTRRM